MSVGANGMSLPVAAWTAQIQPLTNGRMVGILLYREWSKTKYPSSRYLDGCLCRSYRVGDCHSIRIGQDQATGQSEHLQRSRRRHQAFFQDCRSSRVGVFLSIVSCRVVRAVTNNGVDCTKVWRVLSGDTCGGTLVTLVVSSGQSRSCQRLLYVLFATVIDCRPTLVLMQS